MNCTRLFGLLALVIPAVLAAEERRTDSNLHGWFIYFGDHPVASSRWGLHLEGQLRRHDFVATGQQLMLRPAVNYQLTRHLMLTAGYAFVRVHSYSDYATPVPAMNEHRVWEQAWFKYKAAGLGWTTRIRMEHRFVPVANTQTGATGYRFENRLRAWQQVTKPLNRRLYLTGYDEVWFYVKPYVSNSAFDQNRAYAALGVNLKPSLRFEMGYMNQALLHRSGSVLESNHTLMFALYGTGGLFDRR